MLEGFKNLFKKKMKKEQIESSDANSKSKEAAKERLHLVLMQDRANVSVDFLDMMKQEIIDVIKKYIDVDESEMDVRITNKINDDGTNGAPALYANIPIISIKNDNTVKKVAGMKIAEIKNLEKNSENKNEKNIKTENNKENVEKASELEKKTTESKNKENKEIKENDKNTKKDNESIKEQKQVEGKKNDILEKKATKSAKLSLDSKKSKKTASKKDINKKTAISKK